MSVVGVAGAVGIGLMLGWSLGVSKEPAAKAPMAELSDRPTVPRPSFLVEGTAAATVTDLGGTVRQLLSGQEWLSGERLRTELHPIELATRDDSAIEVEAHSDLQLMRADLERWFRLGTGAVEVHVAKLKAGERFVIVTPDAEVEVRGTRFRVAVIPVPAGDGCRHGSVTRVSVTEGIVAVRSLGQESRVPAGAGWPADCFERLAPIAPSPAVGLRAAPKRETPPRPSAVESAPPDDLSPSTLGIENDLFRAALKAANGGDRRDALQLLDVLLARFPASPLKQSALVERAKLIGSAQSPR